MGGEGSQNEMTALGSKVYGNLFQQLVLLDLYQFEHCFTTSKANRSHCFSLELYNENYMF